MKLADKQGEKNMEGGGNSKAVYRDCLRNHAATLGSYATDGCGEFTLNSTSPGGLQCIACGCHRNFHRKVTFPPARGSGLSYGSRGGRDTEMTAELMDYSGGGNEGRPPNALLDLEEADRSGKKRFRTKFTADQKEKMLAFAEKLGWKLQRRDLDDEIESFCRGVGVSRQVFKVWMHNHKNSSSSASTGNATSSLTDQ